MIEQIKDGKKTGTKLTKSKRFTGVYHSVLSNGDKSFYVVYKINGKTNKVFIGKESEGINEPFCHQKRNEAINKLRFGDDTPIIKHKQKDGITFKEAVNRYVQSKDISKKVSHAYTAIENIFGSNSLDTITPETIDKFKKELVSNNKSPKTVLSYLERISAVFNFAIDRELFKGLNPCKKVDKPKIDNARERFLNHDEVEQLKEAVKDKSELLLFVELSLSTGGRLETITSITKKDINLTNGIINLKNHKTNNTYSGYIDNTSSLLPLLTQRYRMLKNPNDLLLDTRGRAINQESFKQSVKCISRSIQKALQPILNKLFNQGLDAKDAKNRVVIHTLRHTFASHLAINSVPIYTIMELLDHKNIEETLRYAKLSPKNGREAIRGLWK
ncbi:MAG: site-specific integrase [Campylobacteraceae bacterium]|jgi:integrase|nr:site-specific integrase [Campylobacteraceae bacterium]